MWWVVLPKLLWFEFHESKFLLSYFELDNQSVSQYFNKKLKRYTYDKLDNEDLGLLSRF